MKKIFIVSEYIHGTQNSTGYIWERVVEKLSSVELVGVISPRVQYGDELVGVLDLRFVQRAFNKNNLRSRLWGQIILTLKFSWRICGSIRKGDVLLSGTNPAVLLVIIPLLKAIFRFKWVLLVHDVFPENLVPGGIVRKDQIAYSALSLFFSRVYASADRLLVIGRDMKEVMSSKVGNAEKVVFVPNWASDRQIFPIPRQEFFFADKGAWKGRIVFQFFGNIGRLQGIDNILAAIERVRNPKAVFLFVGDGAMAESVKIFAQANSRSNVIYHEGIPSAEKNIGLAACDVALVSLEKGMLGLGVPSKSYYSMAADRPLLAIVEKTSEVWRLIDEHGIGWHCEPGDPQALAELIDRIADEDLELKKGLPRQVLQQHFNEDKVLDLFSQQVRDVLH